MKLPEAFENRIFFYDIRKQKRQERGLLVADK